MLVKAMLPSGSLEPTVEADTLRGAVPDVGVTDSEATGGLCVPELAPTVK